MKKYFFVSRNAIQNEIAYKNSYWASIIGILLKMFVLYFLWLSIYSSHSMVGIYSFSGMISYMIVSLILNQLNSFCSGRILSLMIARGEIAVELIRPYNLVIKLLFHNFGVKFVDIIKYVFIITLSSILFLPLKLESSIISWCFFIFSSIIGMISVQLIDIILAMLAFKTTNTWGILILRNSLLTIFSGAMLPLDLFPKWFQSIAVCLPFKSAVYDPINILNSSSFSYMFNTLFFQLGWLLILSIIVFVSYNLAVKKVMIFGG